MLLVWLYHSQTTTHSQTTDRVDVDASSGKIRTGEAQQRVTTAAPAPSGGGRDLPPVRNSAPPPIRIHKVILQETTARMVLYTKFNANKHLLRLSCLKMLQFKVYAMWKECEWLIDNSITWSKLMFGCWVDCWVGEFISCYFTILYLRKWLSILV